MHDDQTQPTPETPGHDGQASHEHAAAAPCHTPPPPPYWAHPPRKASLCRRIFVRIGAVILIISVLMNLYLIGFVAAQMESGFDIKVIRKGEVKQTVAIYNVDGVIDSKAADRFARFAGKISGEKDVKAVVIRVNSPGGGVSASDQIHHQIAQLKDKGKIVVISMGAVAASGGYYISAGADEIVAEPTTITGSIGAIMGWLVVRGTLEKIGMETVMIKSSHAQGWKDEISSLQLPDERQRKHLQSILDNIQDTFEGVVRKGRGSKLNTRESSYSMRVGLNDDTREIDITETEPLNGKIYLADEAIELGLIDSKGYLGDAVDKAAELAGLGKPHVVRYRIRTGLLSQLVGSKRSTAMELGVDVIDRLQTPRIMLMWKAD